MINTDFALMTSAAFAGLAFVLAIPQPAADFSQPSYAPAQIVMDRAHVALASDWKWPLAEEADVVATDTVETPASEEAPKRHCRRRRCR
jgi:hypothetical protein